MASLFANLGTGNALLLTAFAIVVSTSSWDSTISANFVGTVCVHSCSKLSPHCVDAAINLIVLRRSRALYETIIVA
jgi:hypothetical protein